MSVMNCLLCLCDIKFGDKNYVLPLHVGASNCCQYYHADCWENCDDVHRRKCFVCRQPLITDPVSEGSSRRYVDNIVISTKQQFIAKEMHKALKDDPTISYAERLCQANTSWIIFENELKACRDPLSVIESYKNYQSLCLKKKTLLNIDDLLFVSFITKELTVGYTFVNAYKHWNQVITRYTIVSL